MDNLDFLKEILISVKCELIKFRVGVVCVAIAILFVVSFLGLIWQNTYVSKATIEIDDSNIIQPLLQGTAQFSEVNRIEESRKALFSKEFLEVAARRLGYIDDSTGLQDVTGVLRALRSGLTLEAEKRSSYFTIAYDSTDPEIAYETALAISEEFVKYQQKSQREEGEYAYEFIAKQADQYKKRLEKAEMALQEFKANSLDTNEGVVQSRINDFETEIQNLLLGIQDTRSNISEISNQLRSESKYLEIQSQIFSINQQRSVLVAQLTNLRTQFQDSYPDIIAVKSQLAELDANLAKIKRQAGTTNTFGSQLDSENTSPELLFDNLRSQLSSSEVTLKSQERRLASVRQLLEQEKEKADILAENQSKAADLMRDYTVNKELYEDFLGRKENAELSVAITREGQGLNYKIVSAPSFPFQPAGLTLKHFFLIAPFLSIFVPVGLIVALVLLDPRVRGPSNLMATLDSKVNYLGELGHYYTNFSQRLLNKDVFVLIVMLIIAFVAYVAAFVFGISNTD